MELTTDMAWASGVSQGEEQVACGWSSKPAVALKKKQSPSPREAECVKLAAIMAAWKALSWIFGAALAEGGRDERGEGGEVEAGAASVRCVCVGCRLC